MMPYLPLKDIDVLVVDRLGKDISGSGMDSEHHRKNEDRRNS